MHIYRHGEHKTPALYMAVRPFCYSIEAAWVMVNSERVVLSGYLTCVLLGHNLLQQLDLVMVSIHTGIHFASTSTKALASSWGLIKHLGVRILDSNTLIKKIIFFIYKEIQMGSVAKSYMRKGFVIYEEMRKNVFICIRRPLVIYE